MGRRRRERARTDKQLGLVLFVVGFLLLCGMAGGAWWLRKTKIVLDAENCPVPGGPRAVHLIMIDRSDPISGQQAQQIRQILQAEKDHAPFGTRFDVYTFEGDALNELKPIVRLCAPGKSEDANELIENPEKIRRQYNEKFSSVLDRSIEDLLKATTKPNSPIIESIRAAAISSFGSITPDRIPLKATLISDMVQHSGSASHFRTLPDFDTLSRSASWASIKPDFHGAEVRVLYLLRFTAVRGGVPIQNRGHQLFWNQLISASRGRPVSIDVM